MLKQILRRSLSALLSIAMLLTVMSAAFTMTASAQVTVSTAADPADVYFVVPEAIYLKPTWNAFYQSQQMPFQIYVNNTLSGSNVTCDTNESTQGKMYFNFSGTSSVQITFDWLNENGALVYDGSITFGNGISRTAGTAYTTTPSAKVINITAGTSPTMETTQNGAYIRWKATFTDNSDGREKTAVAYTYVYKPYVEPVGVVSRTLNNRAGNSYGSNISWISGVHGIVANTAGTHYPNTTLSSNGRGLLPISSTVQNGVLIDDLYAQLASTTNTQSRFYYTDISNSGPEGWINQTTSPLYVPDKSIAYMNNDCDGSNSGDNAFYSLQWSPTAALSVDNSRYTNLNQIPNLSIGLMVTDDEGTENSGAWFMSNYTGVPATETIRTYTKNSTSNAETLWNRYAASGIIASAGSYASPEGGAESEGVKVNKKWPKAFTSSATSTTYYVGAGYFNHDDDGDHYGGDTIWNVAELRAQISFYNKMTLRNAVQTAIRKSAILNAAYYDVSSAAWINYQNLFAAASMALTKLNGTFHVTATVGGSTQTYTSPATLATALDNAVNALLQGSGRVSRTVTQTNIGLLLQSNGTYKCVAIQNGTAKQTSTFKTYDKVTISADGFAGYSFLGLVRTTYAQTAQVGSIVQVPSSFTTSAPGAAISGSTVTYTHTDTTGTDGNGNIYYTYYYLVNTYSVRFESNGGTGTMPDQAFAYGEEQILSANAFTRRAYAFAGWATSATGSIVYADEARVNNLSSVNGGTVHLYAVWTPETYKITYNTQGGSVIGTYTTSYTVETPIGLPDAVKPGYTLSGWRANGAGNWGEMSYGKAASVPAGKYGNVTLSAQWSAISYAVAFNGNGATSGSMDNQSFLYEEERNLTANAYQRTGYTFAGWALTQGATAATFKDKALVSNLTTTANDTVTLYAVWTAAPYSILYNTEGGTIADTAYTEQYIITDDIHLPVRIEKTGYTFSGWKPAASIGNWNAQTIYTGTINAGLYGSVTLNAQWTTQDYTILYNANGGNITSTGYTTEYKITTAITLPSAQRNGYLLSGWEADGSGNWNTILYTVGTVGSGKYGNVTMTAKWIGITYQIAFNGNGSTDGMMYNQSATYGSQVTLTANAYVKSGYTFKGWATSDTATTAAYADKATVSNLSATQNATVTLYAVWSKVSYTVTYEPMGGTITNAGTKTYSVTDLLRLSDVERTGYTFTGWTPESSVGSWQALMLYSGTLNAGHYGNVKLVAQWSKNVYAIRYDAAGGTLSGNYSTEYSVDTVITLPTIARTGFAFDGWQADAAWNNILIQSATVPAGHIGNVVLRAVWAQRNYTVRFNACGGNGTMEPQTMQFDVAQALRLNAFTRDGYNFDGWAAEEGGTAVYANGDTVLNLSNVDDGVVDLYAVWTRRSFTVKYDLNGASGSMLNSTVTMDSTPITLRNCTQTEVTMNGIPYQFSGWAYTKADAAAGIAAYENKASFVLNSDVLSKANVDWSTTKPTITLYAVWVNIKVTLDGVNGAVVDDERHLIYGVEERVTERTLREKYLTITGYGTLEIDYVSYVGTGTVIRLVNSTGEVVDTYQLVIFGDVDGDGVVGIQDIASIKRIMSGAQEEDEDSLAMMAADLDDDGAITLMDITTAKGIISGAVEYDQANKSW